ncbi:hypothetical protein EHQ53_13510 [Leptospira langatensis]|uniref:DAPG hydrolase PhiG domain-containing protein n=1 Tax=Leptospira langatensis TaxID=2484983 RepID=A0A5F1ZTL5_9LEPT|nr:hypothetical protein [Leptospira langatensis]TGK02616.1 hypothetical protein EHO57_04600 [Leptospira langatensis]TGL40182.1 hypothetical protein EHQ53_13510 [Leptospira langatensis]
MGSFWLIALLALFLAVNFGLLIFSKPRRLDDLFDGEFTTSVKRLSNGAFQVSVRTPMPGVSPEMVGLWFSEYLRTTEDYKRWHPRAHVWMDWESKQPGILVGASHLVHEYIGPTLMKLRINFIDPKILFGYDPNNKDHFVVCAFVGDLNYPVNFGFLCHSVRKTAEGAEMRSRFWLGHVRSRGATIGIFNLSLLANLPILRFLALRRSTAEHLQIHCLEEMGILAGFLPSLYEANSNPMNSKRP